MDAVRRCSSEGYYCDKISIEKLPIAFKIIKNQNENPAVTASDLNRGDDNSILNRINECG